MKNDKQKQFWMLRRYLKQKGVDAGLTMRMLRFLEHQCAKQEKLIQAGKVGMLTQISDQLASELAFELHGPTLKGYAFFNYVSDRMKAVAFRICHTALKAQQVAKGDVVFNVGDEAKRTFIITAGDLRYTHRDGALLKPPLRT